MVEYALSDMTPQTPNTLKLHRTASCCNWYKWILSHNPRIAASSLSTQGASNRIFVTISSGVP
jgi:hypothetical protein